MAHARQDESTGKTGYARGPSAEYGQRIEGWLLSRRLRRGASAEKALNLQEKRET